MLPVNVKVLFDLGIFHGEYNIHLTQLGIYMNFHMNFDY